jgi:hypothetical protein
MKLPLGLIACGFVAASCDFGIGGATDGCASVKQGNYDFPVKRVVDGALAVRATQTGLDAITLHVRELVLGFFDADANGRALIPLSSLGIGSFYTSLGPFDANVRDLVVAVDFSALQVRLVPGSSPARLEISIENAVVSLADGAVSGAIDAFLFTGNAACRLADGPNGHTALLSMRLALELDSDSFGVVQVRVLPSTFDLQDLAISIETDCSLYECLDGLTPPDDGECFECETICPVVDLGAALASLVRSLFDGLIDQLLNLLADEIANLVLDQALNGKPLAIEGTLDLASMLGPLLSWMQSAKPLGILARPADEGFKVTGSGGALGLDVVLDAGLDSTGTPHPCVGTTGEDPHYEAAVRPILTGYAQLADGTSVPYDVAFAVSDAIVNEAIWALWKSGTLCIDASTDDLATLTSGRLLVTAGTLDLLLPGLAGIAGKDAPIRISILPKLQHTPNPIAFGPLGSGAAGSPTLTITLAESEVALEALVGDAWLRLITFRADLVLGADVAPVLPLSQGKLEIRVAKVEVANLAAPSNAIFKEAHLDLIAPFVVDLALGFLADQPITIDLGTKQLGAALGIPIAPVVKALGPADEARRWLGVYLGLEYVPPEALTAPAIEVIALQPGSVHFHAIIAAGQRFIARADGALWSQTFTGPGPHLLRQSALWLVGTHAIATRAVGSDGRAGEAREVATVTIDPRSEAEADPAADAPAIARVVDAAMAQRAAAAQTRDDEGCGVGAAAPWAVLVAVAVLAVFLVRTGRRRGAAR